jgi:multidrug transporter EmrE-like cation transporter
VRGRIVDAFPLILSFSPVGRRDHNIKNLSDTTVVLFSRNDVMKEWSLSWGMLVLSVIFNALGVFIIKLRLNEIGVLTPGSWKAVFSYFFVMMKSPLVVVGLVLFFLAPFLFVIALSRMDIVVAYPAQIGLNFFILVVLAVIFLGEQITLLKVWGTVLVLTGVYLLNKSG